MTLESFVTTSNAGPKMLEPLPGCLMRWTGHPVASLRPTTGYILSSLRDIGLRNLAPKFLGQPRPNANTIRKTHFAATPDAGGIPACNRSSSEVRAPRKPSSPPPAPPPPNFSKPPSRNSQITKDMMATRKQYEAANTGGLRWNDGEIGNAEGKNVLVRK